MSGIGSNNGWLEAAIAWEVCASLHRQYCKGKDALFTTRQADFVKHAENARWRASHGQAPAAQALDDGCPHGSKHIVHDCMRCGAPVCCGKCCAEDAQALDAREKLHTDVARAIWEVMREYEDRCDLELEDIGCSHVVWQLANAAIAAKQGGAA